MRYLQIIIICGLLGMVAGCVTNSPSSGITHAFLAKVVPQDTIEVFKIEEVWMGKESDIHPFALYATGFGLTNGEEAVLCFGQVPSCIEGMTHLEMLHAYPIVDNQVLYWANNTNIFLTIEEARKRITGKYQKKAEQGQLFTVKAGFYPAGDPNQTALWDSLGKSSLTITVSRQEEIKLCSKSDKTLDSVSIEALKAYLEKTKDREQATIMGEKNYTGQNHLDEKIVELLRKAGFKTIIKQVANSQGTVIEKVIRN